MNCPPQNIEELLQDVMQAHADPNDPEYNGCDNDPCCWCENAKEAMCRTKKVLSDIELIIFTQRN